MNHEQLKKLREPFPANQINYLPKGGVKLAYVGHAALTDRLLDADPTWTWEPLALDAKGLPALDEAGGLWIKLTVCGVTRLGYGDAGAKKGADATKERIGDALRNAAMRFGAALDLWHKGELHAHDEQAEEQPKKAEPKQSQKAEPKQASKASPLERFKGAIADGKAADVAQFLSTLPQEKLDPLWEQFSEAEQEALSIAWPKTEGA